MRLLRAAVTIAAITMIWSAGAKAATATVHTWVTCRRGTARCCATTCCGRLRSPTSGSRCSSTTRATRRGYATDNGLSTYSDRLMARGYALLGVSVRGTGCSQGKFDPFDHTMGEDGYDAVEWAARQPWSDGKVGMIGVSFGGITQLLTAGQQPPHLRAIAASSATSDLYRDVAYPGGILEYDFIFAWTGIQKEGGTTSLASVAAAEGDSQCMVNSAQHETAYDTQHFIPKLVLDHPYTSDENYLWETRKPENAIPHIFVRGADNSFVHEVPHVAIWMESKIQNASGDENVPSWSINLPQLPHQTPTRLYLGAGETLTPARPSHPEAPDQYAYPLQSPDVLEPGPEENGTSMGQLTLKAPVVPGGDVAYTTPPLGHDLVVAGPASLDLWLSSSATDTDLQATITEVRPDGQEEYVQRGWLRASHRRLDPERTTALRPYQTNTRQGAQPLVPGQPTFMRMEVFPFAQAFRAGSRIRVYIEAPTGHTGFFAFEPTLAPAVNTVLHDPRHPSRLVLGALAGRVAHAPLPAATRCATSLAGRIRWQPRRHSLLPSVFTSSHRRRRYTRYALSRRPHSTAGHARPRPRRLGRPIVAPRKRHVDAELYHRRRRDDAPR